MLKTTLPSVNDEESESSHVCCTAYILSETAVDIKCPGPGCCYCQVWWEGVGGLCCQPYPLAFHYNTQPTLDYSGYDVKPFSVILFLNSWILEVY